MLLYRLHPVQNAYIPNMTCYYVLVLYNHTLMYVHDILVVQRMSHGSKTLFTRQHIIIFQCFTLVLPPYMSVSTALLFYPFAYSAENRMVCIN